MMRVGSGETGRTTAHLVNAIDERYYEIERLHGAEGARLAAESHTRAIDTVERIVREEQIDCSFERLDGYLFVQEGEDPTELERERDATHRAGLRGSAHMRAPNPVSIAGLLVLRSRHSFTAAISDGWKGARAGGAAFIRHTRQSLTMVRRLL